MTINLAERARRLLGDMHPGAGSPLGDLAALCDELEARRDDGAAMLRESLERAKALGRLERAVLELRADRESDEAEIAYLEDQVRFLQGVESDYREYVGRLATQIEQLGAVPVLPDDYQRNVPGPVEP